jgi:hypothetical protein
MRTQLALASAVLGCVLAACGGDDGGSVGVDAPPPPVDAPAAGGLGQRCNPAMAGADCPADASICLGSSQTAGICTKLCVMNGTFETNAQGQISSATPNPATQNATCAAAYTGTVGTAICASIILGDTPLAYMPPDNPLKASSMYTNMNVACGIQCGANNTCPTGLTPAVMPAGCVCQ